MDEQLQQAFVNLHEFLTRVMKTVREMEGDDAVPDAHRMTCKTLIWEHEGKPTDGK